MNILPDFEAMMAVVSVAEVGMAWTRKLLSRKRMVRLASRTRVIARDISDLVTLRRVKGKKECGGKRERY